MSDSYPIYRKSVLNTCLCQGEILSNVIRFQLDSSGITGADEPPGVVRKEYAYVVVLSQACDLEQEYNREDGGPLLPDVLLCHAPTAEELKATVPQGRELWKRITQNRDDRYHFLQKCPCEYDAPGNGLPELTIDFKKYFTAPTDELYKWVSVNVTSRRAVLNSPYMEHLSDRFTYFLGRVGLPGQHKSEP